MNKTINKFQQGAVLIEFALVIPFFLMLLFAIIEVSWMIHARQTFSNAANFGVKYLSIKGSSINQAEKTTLEYLNKTGINTQQVTVSAFDTNPTCKASFGEVSIKVSAPISSLSITGDPFNLFTKSKSIKTILYMHKECLT